MPWIDGNDDNPSYYVEPKVYACDNLSVDFLIEKKKQHSRDRDEFLGLQKQYAREDREFGKYMREAAAEELKCYRGCCVALSVLANNPPGDSKREPASPYYEWSERELNKDGSALVRKLVLIEDWEVRGYPGKMMSGSKELAPYIDSAFTAVDLEWYKRNITEWYNRNLCLDLPSMVENTKIKIQKELQEFKNACDIQITDHTRQISVRLDKI